MQTIQNRRVLDALEKRGDDHGIARIVDHAIYFRSAADRTAFANTAVEIGFRIQLESQELKSRERPFFLNLTRSDPVIRDHINAVVAQLIDLAEQFNGEYDGWGCEVQKGSSH